MATIQKKKNNNYLIMVYMGKASDGKKLYEYMTYTPTESTPAKIKKEVEKVAHDFEDRVKNGKYYEGEKLTFSDVIELWKEDQSYKDLSQACKEDYVRTLNNRVVPHIGNLIINKISAVNIQSIYNEMEKEGKAPTTIKRVNVTINAVMKYAFRMSIIEANPCDRVRLPKTKKKEQKLRYFDINQTKVFLKALSKSYEITHKEHTRVLKKTGEAYRVPEYTQTLTIPIQYQVYFHIAIYSGFRKSEMLALTWNDIDFENKCIKVNKALVRTREQGKIVKDTKTVAGNRDIKLPDECFKLLREWKTEQMEICLEVGSKWEGFRGSEFDNNFIFIQTETNIGQCMDTDTPYNKFKEIIRLYNDTVSDSKDKLPEIRLHDLRHTSATLLLAQGVDIETVAKRLGHTKASVTLDIYGHALESMDEVASDTLERLLSVSNK